ncbi:serine hydrolase domain-containing protein [Pontibacter ummariensis]|uniref:serine hydrolase domain-containing protein n=1 Tax=Pontibacter ummariensis TaxID=1610492 RepID=UPI00215982E2|nr:serine hydrolase domain-containing protein [Pontibacter ummariensis]
MRHVLQETGTPAAGIAIMKDGEIVYSKGLGLANIEKGVAATEETMFRIGSVSKLFVGLAVLKLQEEGKLQLRDKLSELAPEIEYENPWEQTHPIRIEHLLSHTTGWDDVHRAEYLHNDPTPATLKEGLDFHPHSRVSRWVPGTRMAYSNSGPAVAAYVVQKITGMPFEDYVVENFFTPMGMETITYFPSEDYKRLGATLYEDQKPVNYWNIIMRPSGALNASPRDMAKLLLFFANRGETGGRQLVSPASLERMETPANTLGAKAGLDLGYGLTNYTLTFEDHVFQGHGGSVNGGKSLFVYLPKHGSGYSISINSSDTETLKKLSDLAKHYVLEGVSSPERKTAPKKHQQALPVSGFFYTASLREGEWGFMEPLFSRKVWTERDTLFIQQDPLFGGGEVEKYVAVNDHLYEDPESGLVRVARVEDPLAGTALELAPTDMGNITFASVSTFMFYLSWTILALWLLFAMRAFLLAPVWGIRYGLGKIPGGANIRIRLWPLLSVAFFFVSLLTYAYGSDFEEQLVRPSLLSITIMVSSIAFALTAAWALFIVIQHRKQGLSKWVYWPAALFSVVNFMVACFFT